jgi:hypothetical protein
MTQPSPASLTAFLLVVAGVVGAVVVPARSARVTVGAALWLALTAAIPSALARGMPAPAVFALVLVSAVGVAASPVGARLAVLPLPALVAFQGFRLPLELVLHAWSGAGTVPPQMTWTGDNWDVATGVIALVCAPFARRPAVAWFANVVGFVLLANVVRVVALSTPGPLQRYPEPLLLAFHFPTVWIATVCVAGALLGHLVTFRALLRR